MRLRVILGEVLPVFGTVGLLGLWLFQQVGIEERASELRKVAAARAVYQTYQSHNAVFNAVNEALVNEAASARLRTYQVYNYELGLAALEQTLPTEWKRDIPPALGAYDGTSTYSQKMERTQKRLEALQVNLGKYEQMVRQESARDTRLYLALYITISALSLLGAVLKVIEKLSPAAN
ncbi:MAG TPA: hypothetical protein VI298_02420 [Geobacteraceae bacterium]